MSIDLSNPATPGQRAPFYSVLNDSTEVQGMRTRIAALDDTDGQWASGASTLSPGNPANPKDPDGNGVFWGQAGDGTNWEGGLRNVSQNSAGVRCMPRTSPISWSSSPTVSRTSSVPGRTRRRLPAN